MPSVAESGVDEFLVEDAIAAIFATPQSSGAQLDDLCGGVALHPAECRVGYEARLAVPGAERGGRDVQDQRVSGDLWVARRRAVVRCQPDVSHFAHLPSVDCGRSSTGRSRPKPPSVFVGLGSTRSPVLREDAAAATAGSCSAALDLPLNIAAPLHLLDVHRFAVPADVGEFIAMLRAGERPPPPAVVRDRTGPHDRPVARAGYAQLVAAQMRAAGGARTGTPVIFEQ